MLNVLAKGWVGVLIALIAVGCEWGDRSITLVRPNTDNLQVVFTDTLTIIRSTVMKDSLFTANGNLIAGRFEDTLLGPITSKSFLLPSATSGIVLPERAVYDSIVLATKYVYYYGDTTQRYSVAAHQLTQDITTGPFYNQNGASYEATPLGQASFLPRPRGNDSLRIRLNDQLGLTLFNEATANNIKTQDALLKYFKGVALVVDDAYDSGFLGFAKERTMISLYYHVDGPDGKTRSAFVLPISQFYNQILNDRSGTAFEDLKSSSDRVSTDQTGGVSVVQSGVGLMTRLDFPFLHEFGAGLGKVVVNRAFLRVQLARNQESKGMAPPASIGLYTTGARNEWEVSSQPILVGNLVDDPVLHERYYHIDVTAQVMQLAQSKTPGNFGFLIGPMASSASTYTTSLDRLILPKGGVKLQVYYTTLTD